MTRLFNFEDKKITYEDDPTKAEQLIGAGKAVKLELTELDNYEKQASDIYDTYQKEVERIKNSDNPIFTGEVKEYELNRLKEDYEQKSAEVEQQYIDYRNKALQDAKVKAAQATVKVSDADKLTAEQFATRATLSIASASNTSEALKQIADDIALLTDEQKTALQGEIVRVLSTVDDDYHKDKQAIISAVQDIRNSDLLAYEVAKQLPHTVLTKQRIKRIAESVVKGDADREIGGIDREYYEDHLKGKGSFR